MLLSVIDDEVLSVILHLYQILVLLHETLPPSVQCLASFFFNIVNSYTKEADTSSMLVEFLLVQQVINCWDIYIRLTKL